jgi:hypothetical protein
MPRLMFVVAAAAEMRFHAALMSALAARLGVRFRSTNVCCGVRDWD